jgi:hypothetical protein
MRIACVKKICSGFNVRENWLWAFTATKIDYLLSGDVPHRFDASPCVDGDT